MFWLIIVLSSIFLYWLYLQWRYRRMYELSASIPGPFAWPIIGNSLTFIANPGDQLGTLSNFIQTYGDYLKFWLGPGDFNIVVKNPNDIRILLTSNKLNQKGPLYNIFRDYIGTGILTGGPTWRLYRKIATPSYNKKSVQRFIDIFNKESDDLADDLFRKSDEAFDVYDDVVKITTQCVCQTLMGLSKDESTSLYRLDEVVKLTPKFYALVFNKMTRWWLQIPLIAWLIGVKKTEKQNRDIIMELTSDIIAKRRKSMKEFGVPEEDLLGIVDRFILSGELDEQDLRYETFCLFTTSQEASAKIVSGVLMLLAHLPEWQDKVYNEIVEVLGAKDGPITLDQLKQLHYLDMVYKETLRYFSIAAFIQRSVEEEITINDGKITLPVATSVLIPIHDLHRDPRYWEEPNKVMPERFLPENAHKLVHNAFVPFSLGPMDCLGRVYATAMIKIMTVKVLRKVQLNPGMSLDNMKLDIAISVRPADGYNVRVSPRNK